MTCSIQDMSVSGVLLRLDEELSFFVMMELDIRIYGEGWDNTMPALPVQVVRVNKQEAALRFLDSVEDAWSPPDEEIDTDLGIGHMSDIEDARRYAGVH